MLGNPQLFNGGEEASVFLLLNGNKQRWAKKWDSSESEHLGCRRSIFVGLWVREGHFQLLPDQQGRQWEAYNGTIVASGRGIKEHLAVLLPPLEGCEAFSEGLARCQPSQVPSGRPGT